MSSHSKIKTYRVEDLDWGDIWYCHTADSLRRVEAEIKRRGNAYIVEVI